MLAWCTAHLARTVGPPGPPASRRGDRSPPGRMTALFSLRLGGAGGRAPPCPREQRGVVAEPSHFPPPI